MAWVLEKGRKKIEKWLLCNYLKLFGRREIGELLGIFKKLTKQLNNLSYMYTYLLERGRVFIGYCSLLMMDFME